MLVDPLGDDPLVVTGSANFSQPSQRINDENMLVIRGDTRVADIYFGEFMRIFDHHYARYLVRKLTRADNHDPNAGYLKDAREGLGSDALRRGQLQVEAPPLFRGAVTLFVELGTDREGLESGAAQHRQRRLAAGDVGREQAVQVVDGPGA